MKKSTGLVTALAALGVGFLALSSSKPKGASTAGTGGQGPVVVKGPVFSQDYSQTTYGKLLAAQNLSCDQLLALFNQLAGQASSLEKQGQFGNQFIVLAQTEAVRQQMMRIGCASGPESLFDRTQCNTPIPPPAGETCESLMGRWVVTYKQLQATPALDTPNVNSLVGQLCQIRGQMLGAGCKIIPYPLGLEKIS